MTLQTFKVKNLNSIVLQKTLIFPCFTEKLRGKL